VLDQVKDISARQCGRECLTPGDSCLRTACADFAGPSEADGERR
jgi:hypothetical protein